MVILENRNGEHPKELSPRARANMERCANFLVRMIKKYGNDVLAEIEEEEREATGRQGIKNEQESSATDA